MTDHDEATCPPEAHVHPLLNLILLGPGTMQLIVMDSHVIAAAPNPVVAEQICHLINTYGLLDLPNALTGWPAPAGDPVPGPTPGGEGR